MPEAGKVRSKGAGTLSVTMLAGLRATAKAAGLPSVPTRAYVVFPTGGRLDARSVRSTHHSSIHGSGVEPPCPCIHRPNSMSGRDD
ncbi:hypothetical protein R70199_08053 [Paraburkholderia domus]|nr:hypothetical protein R70199_08053 [Paraburkholderia domus]